MWFYFKKGKGKFRLNDYWENLGQLPVSNQIPRCICLDNFLGKMGCEERLRVMGSNVIASARGVDIQAWMTAIISFRKIGIETNLKTVGC